MYLKPYSLSTAKLSDEELKEDKTNCRKFGPCGLGQKAIYMSTVFIDRRCYVPINRVQRAYKKVAMSKGGYTGKGMFGSVAYLVVEYDNGEKVQSTFKVEKYLDEMLRAIKESCPGIITVSAAAQKRLEIARHEQERLFKKNLSGTAKRSIEELTDARAYLEKKPELCDELARTSKAKRVNQITKDSYRWVAYVIIAAGIIAAAYGVYCMLTHTGFFGLYFLLIGLAFVFMFAGISVRPTAAQNKEAVEKELEEARKNMADYIASYPGFPLPARYAHPLCITRMIRSIRYGRTETVDDAYRDLKEGLKALNSSVEVSQEEYDEVVAVKPMFLIEDYE